jgi:hypothetical protein
MVGNEISRISPISSPLTSSSNGTNSNGHNMLPLIAIMASALVLGSIVLIHTHRKIEKDNK